MIWTNASDAKPMHCYDLPMKITTWNEQINNNFDW